MRGDVTAVPGLIAGLAALALAACALEPGIGLSGIAVDPAGTRIYVAGGYGTHPGARSVWMVDGRTNMVVRTVPMPHFPARIAVQPDGERVYVTIEPGENLLHVLQAATLRTLGQIPLPLPPAGGLVFDPAGSLLFVGGSGGVIVIDTARQVVAATIPVSGSVGHLAFNEATGVLLATSFSAPNLQRTLRAIDPSARTATALALEGVPTALATADQQIAGSASGPLRQGRQTPPTWSSSTSPIGPCSRPSRSAPWGAPRASLSCFPETGRTSAMDARTSF